MLTQQHLTQLANPFPKERLGVKIQSLSREKNKAMLVCYLQHTDVYGRLEEIDPAWTAQVIHEHRIKYNEDEVTEVRMRMTLLGVSRENVGEGHDAKSAYSDAFKRVAMLFGVGRYLYDTETVWVDYNESRDKYRTWTYDDFVRAVRPGHAKPPVAESQIPPKSPNPIQPTGVIPPKSPLAMLSDTRITFGKYKDKTLGAVPLTELMGYKAYIINTAARDNKPIQGEVEKFIKNVTAYVDALGENQSTPSLGF